MTSFLNRRPKLKEAATLVVSVVTITALLLTGCNKSSEPKTVESLINSNEDIARTIQGGAQESGVNVDIKENTITYSYDISSVDGVTEELLKDEDYVKMFETSLESQKPGLAKNCAEIEKIAGIEGVVIKVVYTYGDKEVVSTTVTSADAASDDAASEKTEEGAEK